VPEKSFNEWEVRIIGFIMQICCFGQSILLWTRKKEASRN